MKELELELRKRAKDHMALALADKPNGTTTRPPPWYRRADDLPSSTPDFGSLIGLSRPRIWIKDWDKGHIRPRGQLDDLKQAQFEKAERREQRPKNKAPPAAAAAAAAIAVPRASGSADASATAGGIKSNKRKAVELDDSEDEQEKPATQLAIRLKMPKSIAADESQTELVCVRVRVIANKRRRLAEITPDGDDSEVVSSWALSATNQPTTKSPGPPPPSLKQHTAGRRIPPPPSLKQHTAGRRIPPPRLGPYNLETAKQSPFSHSR
ncbi:hypothetical protein QBC37DRAFT_370224 [Rhypophila decipiens]|uniref:Uncharacterized protein n=1 Tax=Rhypophila decipiens TaxID=261697 RepID=A0AAN7BAX5_9PEZI|nr:hypothetical protein QBC37DRAFT_370224 [Rhypophila decipiens]